MDPAVKTVVVDTTNGLTTTYSRCRKFRGCKYRTTDAPYYMEHRDGQAEKLTVSQSDDSGSIPVKGRST